MSDTPEDEIVFNNQMILIGGVSGKGKSAALRNIRNQEQWMYINTEAGKRLPFKNKFMEVRIDEPYQILGYVDDAIAAGDDVVAQALAWAAPLIGNGPVLVYATAESSAVQVVQAQLGVERAGEMVERTLSRIAAGLVDSGVRQLIVAGGETSGAVVQALGITRMTIGPQIDPGVPWTSAHSAQCPGEPLHLALKSGNFGTVDFFTKAFTALKRLT